MKFLRNPVIAAVLAIVIVAGSTFLNISTRLEKACQKTENAFFEVKNGRAPAYYVDQCISSAAALVTVAGHYENAGLNTAAAEMKEARSRLAYAYDGKDISDIYTGMRQLLDSLDPYAAAVGTVSLSEADQRTCTDMMNALSGAYRAVEKSDYNEKTARFIDKTYDRFPARLLADMLDIDAPELFGPERED